jgi:aldehyde:ferredoxin oxidoreductase
MKKLLRIDLSNKKFHYEDVPVAYANLGGRGLTSKIVSEEVPPRTDALGIENKLVFAPGILAATPAPNNSRLSVGGKSPLTGTIKEANSGGAAAQKLARLGIQGIVVEGASSALTMVKVTKDGVTFIAVEGFKGMGNYDLIDKLKVEHGDNISIISIGPGGEKILKAASVSVTSPDFKIRMASRGGLGAVMGSKKLKAIIVDDTNAAGIEVNDGAKL